MSEKVPKKYERGIKEAINKKPEYFTESDKKVLDAIAKAEFYFSVYDATENKNTLEIFRALLLRTKNRMVSVTVFADEFGLSPRSVLRHKKKVLQIYKCIYDGGEK